MSFVAKICVVAICIAVLYDSACAQSRPDEKRPSQAKSRVNFSIPGGELGNSLARFSEQSGWQIAYDPAQVRGYRTPEFRGTFAIEEMLDRLLRGTDLTWTLLNDTTVVVRSQTDHATAT